MSSLQVAVLKINGLIVLESRDNVYLSNRMNTLIRVLYLYFYSPFAKPVEIINFVLILSLSKNDYLEEKLYRLFWMHEHTLIVS